MNEIFGKKVFELLTKHKSQGLFVNSGDSEHFKLTRKWQGIADSEAIYGMADESVFETGKFGITFCSSGICWRGTVKDPRQSLLWSELPQAVEKTDKKISGLVLSGDKRMPTTIFSAGKLKSLLLELSELVSSFDDLSLDPSFKSTLAYTPGDGLEAIEELVDKDVLLKIGGNIKKYPMIWGVGLVFVLFSLVFGESGDTSTSRSNDDGSVVIKKGSLFCTSKHSLDQQSKLLARNIMEYAPGCLSTGAEIEGKLWDVGLGIRQVRANSNGQMYWVFSNSLKER